MQRFFFRPYTVTEGLRPKIIVILNSLTCGAADQSSGYQVKIFVIILANKMAILSF